MMRVSESVAIAASGVSLASLDGGYYSLALAGAIIGVLAWFYGHTHADPKWTVGESVSELLKFILFGLLVMPAVVDASAAQLAKYGVNSPSVRIALGGFAAFAITQLIAIGMKYLSGLGVRRD